uniref:Uncharacterized protein n=1 Tax=Oryza nivara TaxID=4536 RepID=A0A0E0I7W4_ORYNI
MAKERERELELYVEKGGNGRLFIGVKGSSEEKDEWVTAPMEWRRRRRRRLQRAERRERRRRAGRRHSGDWRAAMSAATRVPEQHASEEGGGRQRELGKRPERRA